jgi:hypothetical protein
MKIDEKGLVIHEILVLNFYFWNVGLRLTNNAMDNSWEQMLLVGAKKANVRQKKKQQNHLATIF